MPSTARRSAGRGRLAAVAFTIAVLRRPYPPSRSLETVRRTGLSLSSATGAGRPACLTSSPRGGPMIPTPWRSRESGRERRSSGRRSGVRTRRRSRWRKPTISSRCATRSITSGIWAPGPRPGSSPTGSVGEACVVYRADRVRAHVEKTIDHHVSSVLRSWAYVPVAKLVPRPCGLSSSEDSTSRRTVSISRRNSELPFSAQGNSTILPWLWRLANSP